MSEEKSVKKKGKKIPNDTWRWLVLVCVMTVTTIRKFQFFSIAIVIADLHLVFHTPMTELTIISVLPFIIGNFIGFFPLIVKKQIKKHPNLYLSMAGVTVETLGSFLSSLVDTPHWLFLTFSILIGIGTSFSSICGMATIGEYFPRDSKHFILATSLIFMSSPLAKTIFNPLSYLIIDHFSWRGVFILQGCCSVVGIFCSMSNLSKNEPSSDEEEEDNEKIKSENLEINDKDPKSYQSISPTTSNNGKTGTFGMTELQEEQFDNKEQDNSDTSQDAKLIIQNEEKKGLWGIFVESDCKLEMATFFVSMALTTTAYQGFYTILPHFLMVKSLNTTKASLVVTSYGVSELLTTLIAALLSYKLRGKMNIVFIITHLCLAGLFLGLMSASTYEQIIPFIVFFGLNTGFFHAYTLSNATEVTNLPVAVSWAFTCLSRGCGVILVPIVTGLIYDLERNYNHSLLACAVFISISASGYTAISIIKFYKNKKGNK